MQEDRWDSVITKSRAESTFALIFRRALRGARGLREQFRSKSFFGAVRQWRRGQHCINHNTTSAGLSVPGATSAAWGSGERSLLLRRKTHSAKKTPTTRKRFSCRIITIPVQVSHGPFWNSKGTAVYHFLEIEILAIQKSFQVVRKCVAIKILLDRTSDRVFQASLLLAPWICAATPFRSDSEH